MKRRLGKLISVAVVLLLAWVGLHFATRLNWNPKLRVGQQVDSLNGVAVFYNGGVDHTAGRNLAPDGYNLGIRYQCVEFVKRYYHQRLGHRMPDTFGHAKDFFDPKLRDGEWNPKRDLTQFRNGGAAKPQAEDILVFGPTLTNRFGHVAIVASVGETSLEIIQQNPGPFGKSRETKAIRRRDGNWVIEDSRALGWLRKIPATGMPASSSASRPGS